MTMMTRVVVVVVVVRIGIVSGVQAVVVVVVVVVVVFDNTTGSCFRDKASVKIRMNTDRLKGRHTTTTPYAYSRYTYAENRTV